jgi:proton-translocating NADH-quinone oxidoreductase chain M
MVLNILIILGLGLSFIVFIPNKYNQFLSHIALTCASIVFLISLQLWINFDGRTAKFQHVVDIFGYGPSLGVDGISLFFLLLTTFLFLLCILASWGKTHTKFFLICFLSIELLLILVFSVIDLIWFYVCFESVLIPIFLLIGTGGSRSRKIRASYFFFVYTFLGSLFILAAILCIYKYVGTTNYESLLAYPFSVNQQKWLWFGFFLSFAVKVPIFPFHSWLPEAHVEAPTTGSAILAGVLLKLGIFGFLRYSLPLFPIASIYYAPFVYTLCLIGVWYTSLTAIRQTDLKRIIAYASVAHINLVVIGIFSFTSIGLHGAIIQSLSHGFVSAGLFLLIGSLYDRFHTRLYLHYGGLAHLLPILANFFVIFTIANISLPATSGFVGEIAVLIGIFEINPLASFFGAISIILGGAYSLWLLNRILYGNLKTQYLHSFSDLNRREVYIYTILTFIILYFGIYPEIFFRTIESSVETVLIIFKNKI